MSSTMVGPALPSDYVPPDTPGNFAPPDLIAAINNEGVSNLTPGTPGIDPEALPTIGTPDHQNTGMLQLLQTAIATGGALGQIALGATPQRVRPGQGSQNPARPGLFSTAQSTNQIQGFLIIIALVLGAVLLFRMFGKK